MSPTFIIPVASAASDMLSPAIAIISPYRGSVMEGLCSALCTWGRTVGYLQDHTWKDSSYQQVILQISSQTEIQPKTIVNICWHL